MNKSSLVLGIKESFFARREGLHVHLQLVDKRNLDRKEQRWDFVLPIVKEKPDPAKRSSSSSTVSTSTPTKLPATVAQLKEDGKFFYFFLFNNTYPPPFHRCSFCSFYRFRSFKYRSRWIRSYPHRILPWFSLLFKIGCFWSLYQYRIHHVYQTRQYPLDWLPS